VALLQSNAVVTCLRGGVAQAGSTNVPAYIMVGGPMNVDFQGVQVTTDVLLPPETNWQVNDVLSVGTDTMFQVGQYTVSSTRPPRGIRRLQVWKIRVNGVIR
jgi:hypothetical protein